MCSQKYLESFPMKCFLEFNPIPLATALLAQVHATRTFDGKIVAVKFQPTHLTNTTAIDSATVELVTNVLHWSEEPEEGEGHEEAGDPDPPTGDQPSDGEEEDEDADREEDEEDAGDDGDEDEDDDDEEDDKEEDRDDEEESDAAPHHSGDDTIALDPPLIPQQGEQEVIRRPITSTI
ncbi:hypothetical protein SUGI_1190540 [Cryptomeria japonica]|nr:hypothetical protein SUGI_1190540 [Cryptomeria japonica]